jgi:peroxiredoxin
LILVCERWERESLVLTPELERYTRALHKKLDLPFDILTDLHLTIAERFGLVFTFPDYLRDLYRSWGTSLDSFHDESEYRLPMPARYIVDSNSLIREAEVKADYTFRPEPSDTLRLLKEITRTELGH